MRLTTRFYCFVLTGFGWIGKLCDNGFVCVLSADITFLRQLNFEHVISCRLNPLKVWLSPNYVLYFVVLVVLYIVIHSHIVRSLILLQCHAHNMDVCTHTHTQVCLPTVVEVFASITSRHEIVFCYTILEQNKRLILSSEKASTQQQQNQTNVLDCFFPFDPYNLKRLVSPSSSRLLSTCTVSYRNCVIGWGITFCNAAAFWVNTKVVEAEILKESREDFQNRLWGVAFCFLC